MCTYTNKHVHIHACGCTAKKHHKTTVTCEANQPGYLLDHDAGEIAVLKGSVDRVPGSQICSQLHVEFVEFVHLLKCEFYLTSPVCGYKPGREREEVRKGRERREERREGKEEGRIKMEGRREGKGKER